MSDANNIYNLYLEQYTMYGELQRKLKEINNSINRLERDFGGAEPEEGTEFEASGKLQAYKEMKEWLEAMIINYD